MNFGGCYKDSCSQVSLASRNGDLEVLRRLLDEGKDYCVKDNRGWFPIHEAANHGHTQCVEELIKTALKNGDDPLDIWPSPFDVEDRNALVLAARNGHLETVKALLNFYPSNSTDFHSGIEASLNYPEILKFMLAIYTGNINSKNHWNCTLLHSAVDKSPIDSFIALFDYEIDPQTGDEQGRTALHYACEALRLDRLEVVKCLVKNGSDVNTSDDLGCSALFIAAQHGFIDVVLYLLAFHADPYLCFDASFEELDGFTAPINIAAERNHIRILKEFINRMSLGKLLQKRIVCPIINTILNESYISLKTLLAHQEYREWLLHGCGKNVLSYFEHCDLVKAKKGSKIYLIAQHLLEHGARIDPLLDIKPMSCLHNFITNWSCVDVLELLISHGYLECFFGKNDIISGLKKVILNVLRVCARNPKENYFIISNVICISKFFSVVNIKDIYDLYQKTKKHEKMKPIVPPLLHQTRFRIRKIIFEASGHLNNIAMLPIPNLLKKYLRYCLEFDN